MEHDKYTEPEEHMKSAAKRIRVQIDTLRAKYNNDDELLNSQELKDFMASENIKAHELVKANVKIILSRDEDIKTRHSHSSIYSGYDRHGRPLPKIIVIAVFVLLFWAIYRGTTLS